MATPTSHRTRRALGVASDVHGALTAAVVGFQFALAAGAPWGEFAMGGAWPGRWPPELRLAAVGQGALLIAFALIVRARAGRPPRAWARVSGRLVWLVVAVNGLSALLNLVTPSATERALWAPVALGLLVSSGTVAWLSRGRPQQGDEPSAGSDAAPTGGVIDEPGRRHLR